MSWAFLLVVATVVAAPGADFVITVRNTILHGRSGGIATAVGIGTASLIQGALVSIGVGALIVQSQPLFTALKWIGLAYLVYLGGLSLLSAWRGRYETAPQTSRTANRMKSLRQGFLTNITNPKMLVFYLSLLPQFIGPEASVGTWLLHAWTLPLLGTAWLMIVVVFGDALRERLLRPAARRIMDAAAGLALLGFGARLVLQRD